MAKYAHVRVRLGGVTGNSFAIIGRVLRAMRAAGVPQAEIEAFTRECMAAATEHDDLFRTVARWVTVEGDDDGPPDAA
jgi:hypothetical protein